MTQELTHQCKTDIRSNISAKFDQNRPNTSEFQYTVSELSPWIFLNSRTQTSIKTDINVKSKNISAKFDQNWPNTSELTHIVPHFSPWIFLN